MNSRSFSQLNSVNAVRLIFCDPYIMPALQEKALLVKLFYQNRQNSIAYAKEFHCIKEFRRGPVSPRALLKMIEKFERTVGIWRFFQVENKRKFRLLTSKMWPFAVVKPSSQFLYSSVSDQDVFRLLDMSYSSEHKRLCCSFNFYPYKIKPMHLWQDGGSEVRKIFALEFLTRIVVDVYKT